MAKTKQRQDSIKKDRKSGSKVNKLWLLPGLISVVIISLIIFYFGLNGVLEYTTIFSPSLKILLFILFMAPIVSILAVLSLRNNLIDRYPGLFIIIFFSIFLITFIISNNHYDYLKHICLESKEGKCIDWRNAKPCEITPYEAGCVCDNVIEKKVGDTIYRKCLEAHEATECDLNNPGYIKDVFGCRRKGIKDFSCEELLMRGRKGESLCLTNNKWYINGLCLEWAYPRDEYFLRCN